MKVVCVANVGSSLSRSRKAAGYTDDSVFHLTIDGEYDVYAMALFDAGLSVLICDDTGYPRMEPIELFDVGNGHVPAHWEFTLFSGEQFLVKAIWGYSALIHNESHYDDLLQLEPSALQIFYAERDWRAATS